MSPLLSTSQAIGCLSIFNVASGLVRALTISARFTFTLTLHFAEPSPQDSFLLSAPFWISSFSHVLVRSQLRSGPLALLVTIMPQMSFAHWESFCLSES